jgi:hypothetical protein
LCMRERSRTLFLMKLRIQDEVKKGSRIRYDDGRAGHRGVEATVLAVDARGITVQFDDRADTTYIRFSDRRWMDFVEAIGDGGWSERPSVRG